MDETQFCKFISCDETRFTLMASLDPLSIAFSISRLLLFPSSGLGDTDEDFYDNQFHSFHRTLLLHVSNDFLIKCWS